MRLAWLRKLRVLVGRLVVLRQRTRRRLSHGLLRHVRLRLRVCGLLWWLLLLRLLLLLLLWLLLLLLLLLLLGSAWHAIELLWRWCLRYLRCLRRHALDFYRGLGFNSGLRILALLLGEGRLLYRLTLRLLLLLCAPFLMLSLVCLLLFPERVDETLC